MTINKNAFLLQLMILFVQPTNALHVQPANNNSTHDDCTRHWARRGHRCEVRRFTACVTSSAFGSRLTSVYATVSCANRQSMHSQMQRLSAYLCIYTPDLCLQVREFVSSILNIILDTIFLLSSQSSIKFHDTHAKNNDVRYSKKRDRKLPIMHQFDDWYFIIARGLVEDLNSHIH